MPIYSYMCPVCGVTEDVHRKMLERDDPMYCGGCNGKEMRRQISEASFQLKGPGWGDSGYSSHPRNQRGYDPLK